MKNNTANNNKKRVGKTKRYIIITAICLISFLSILVLFNKINDLTKKISPREVKILNRVEGYDNYVVNDYSPTLYAKKFPELKKVLEAPELDEEAYAKLVCKMFISDFFTLNNKFSKNDIGGLMFLYPAIKDNFTLKATDTIYNDIEADLNNNRKQELPIVKEVTIDAINKTTIKYNNNKATDKTGYKVSLSWTYEKDLGYQNKANILLIHNDKRLDIIEITEIK